MLFDPILELFRLGGWVGGWVAGWLAGKELIIRLTQSSWAGARTELGNKEYLDAGGTARIPKTIKVS